MPETPTLLAGDAVASEMLARAQERADWFMSRAGRPPCLATVLVGDDPASATYVAMKRRRGHKVGVTSRDVKFDASASTAEVVDSVAALSADPTVDGILVQHPVSPGVDERAVFEAISARKDVDGVTMASFASMAFGLGGFVSCTPGGIIRLLDHHEIDLEGRHAVVIGRSPILGKPVGMLLLARDASVTYCHSRTVDLPGITRTADVVVAAVGKAELVRGDWIKPGAVVVDAGYNEGNVGDVAFDEVSAVASAITPVPGGVGPMTIALLIEQTVDAAIASLEEMRT
jgi:methylenetetrahydrofolate dehydrogenase (NADP+) / methenyltetrahydrofolate cyclohydrolase